MKPDELPVTDQNLWHHIESFGKCRCGFQSQSQSYNYEYLAHPRKKGFS